MLAPMLQFCDLYHSLTVRKQLYSGTNSPQTHRHRKVPGLLTDAAGRHLLHAGCRLEALPVLGDHPHLVRGARVEAGDSQREAQRLVPAVIPLVLT